MTSDMTLRDHARGAVRDEVAKRAWDLFARQGFEATTVDEIAEAAGMSRRTFFRYFSGKDELVLSRLIESGGQMAEVMEARPADETAWAALRAAFQESVDLQEQHADVSRPLQVMLRTEPSLRATMEERRRLWLDMLVPLVATRLPRRTRSTGPDTRAAAVAGSALACLEAAQKAWAETDAASLGALLDEAMGSVGSV